MGNKKITDLPSATAVNAGDKVEIVQGGTSKQVDANLLSGGNQSLQDVITVSPTVNGIIAESNDANTNIFVDNTKVRIYSSDGNTEENYIEVTPLGTNISSTSSVGVSTPSLTKNGVEVATVNDIPTDRKGTDYYLKTGATTFDARYSTNATAFTSTTQAIGKDAMVAMPFIIEETMTFDRIGAEVTAAVTSGVCSLLIYDSVNNIPTNLVLDAGTISVTSATYQEITINKQLTAGLYYLVLWHNGATTPSFRAMPLASCNKTFGIPSTIGSGGAYTRIFNSKVYTTAPLTYDLTGIGLASINNPIISLRRSA